MSTEDSDLGYRPHHIIDDVRPADNSPQEIESSLQEVGSPSSSSHGPSIPPVSRGRLLRLTGIGLLAYGVQTLGRGDTAAAAHAQANIAPPQPETGTAAELHHQPLRF